MTLNCIWWWGSNPEALGMWTTSYHYSKVHWPKLFVLVRVSFFVQIEQFHYLQRSIIISYLKTYRCDKLFVLGIIASGRSSRSHPVSAQSCCIKGSSWSSCLLLVHVEGVHRSMSLMSSSQLLQQRPACLVRLTWIVFVMGDKWPYSCCFVDSFTIPRSILV